MSSAASGKPVAASVEKTNAKEITAPKDAAQTPTATTETKSQKPKTTSHACSTCKVDKKKADFSQTQWRNCMGKDGVGRCVVCITNSKNERRFGIAADEVRKKIADQKNKCAMIFCKATIGESSVYLDVDRRENVISGALCKDCYEVVRGVSGRIDRSLAVAEYLTNKTKTLSPSMNTHVTSSLNVLNNWSSSVTVTAKQTKTTKEANGAAASATDATPDALEKK